ncbi:MAG: hypothetical protein L3J74_04420 [Bacteroidales bacterium]|nr:hypothetical protein [Bacteroidales bacterium]
MEKITNFKLRAFYPNYFYYNFLLNHQGDFTVHKIGEGYRNPVVEYDTNNTAQSKHIEIDFKDAIFLLNNPKQLSINYIELLIKAKIEDKKSIEELKIIQTEFFLKKINKFKNLQLTENRYIIPSFSTNRYPIEHISHKGAVLLMLSQKAYPVPDFCIISAKAFKLNKEKKRKIIHQAIKNLENMTGQQLGSQDTPLVFAMRCAMPVYIPGLMPTYLNVGVTQQTYVSLKNLYGYHVAGKIYLNNLRTIYYLLFPDKPKPAISNRTQYFTLEQINRKINFFYEEILNKDAALLSDPYYQIDFFIRQAELFYEKNELLINTFLKNKQAYPSFILQKMVWTIRGQDSYPGVLYSRNSYTGEGMQIESVRSIFGEEIMSGSLNAENTDFNNAEEIKEKFPAVYHFLPKLKLLEKEISSPATIEFAAETFEHKSLFAILQLNSSEMSGRAILLAAVQMYRENQITANDVIKLIQSYHLKQIFSPTIDEKTLDYLKPFCRGFTVLPRSAISVKIYFSAAKALEAKQRGETVGFCKDEFVPSDTVVMSEVDAIISLNPAAIHVVTACLRYGVQAFLNLEKYGISLKSNYLSNKQNHTIKEGDWITLNSNNKTIYHGKVKMRPARLQQYINGEQIKLDKEKEQTFIKLADAYKTYQEIVEYLKKNKKAGFNELIRIYRNEKEKAKPFINNWFEDNKDEYVSQILNCELGSHQEQQAIFLLLDLKNKITFFKKVIPVCINKKLKGYTAGSFMLGRFLTLMLPVKFWKVFSEDEILFMLNETVLFEKYIHILYEVGERNLSKARHKILKSGLQNIKIQNFNLKNFTSLKLAFKDWDKITENKLAHYDSELLILINGLNQTFGELYDYTKPWSFSKLESICKDEGLPIPKETDK